MYFCSSVYKEAREDFNAWLKQHDYPVGTHASIPDTSELMYLGGDDYVRKDRLVAGSPDNGIAGDPRRSSPELGKRVFDMKVDLRGGRDPAAHFREALATFPDLAPFSTRNLTTVSYRSACAASSAVRPSVLAALTIDTKLHRQLHGFERQSFALAPWGLHPSRPTAHPRRRHQRRRHLGAVFITSARHVVGMVHEQRIGAVLHQQAHDVGLAEAGGQPERRRSDQGRLEMEVVRRAARGRPGLAEERSDPRRDRAERRPSFHRGA